MRWEQQRRSENVEDRRGRAPVRTGMKLGGGAILLVAVVGLLAGKSPMQILQMLSQVSETSGGGSASLPGSLPREAPQDAPPGAPDPQKEFVAVVLAETEDVWTAQFRALGGNYEKPVLVLFDEAVESACGFTSAAVGPFYCPGDSKVYLDLGFFRELSRRLGAPGDFAQAYVIAHEVGHHVQNQMGVSGKVSRLQRQVSEEEANNLSVRLELQADCLAGVWGHHTQRQKQLLETGDLEEAMSAAAAVGDDKLQRSAGGRVSPESWTHGSSAMRMRWFRAGFDTGRVDACDTFTASNL